MLRLSFSIVIGLMLTLTSYPTLAGNFDTRVPMRTKGAATYYVEGYLKGVGSIEFMVDTGSGYLAINEKALATLKKQDHAHYVRELMGVLANGTELVVPLYSIRELDIGGKCKLKNVEAAVFPGRTRFILGLNALQRAAPFIFSLDPPSLSLSNCQSTDMDWLATEERYRAPDS